jgi:hypothetical protein
MTFRTTTARCAALAAGALIAACSATGSDSPVPPPHQSFGAGSSWVPIVVTNSMSGTIGPGAFSSACWQLSPSLPNVAAGTSSKPVRLLVNVNRPGCNPPPETQIVYSYALPGGLSRCVFHVQYSGPSNGPLGPAYFYPDALGAATCTARWNNDTDTEVLTFAPG